MAARRSSLPRSGRSTVDCALAATEKERPYMNASASSDVDTAHAVWSDIAATTFFTLTALARNECKGTSLTEQDTLTVRQAIHREPCRNAFLYDAEG